MDNPIYKSLDTAETYLSTTFGSNIADFFVLSVVCVCEANMNIEKQISPEIEMSTGHPIKP